MPDPSPQVFFNVATNLLAAIVAYYANAGVDAPANQYVAWPQAIPACESLVVVAGRVFVGTPGSGDSSGERMKAATRRAGDLTVIIWRCAPVPQGEGDELLVTDLEAEQDYAMTMMTDEVCLMRAVQQAVPAGIFADFSKPVTVGPVQPINKQGGIGGMSMAITVEVM